MSKDRGNQRLIPTIRFKGFTDDWEQRKLLTFVERVTKQSESRNIPSVEYEDIQAGVGSLNKDVAQKTVHKRGVEFQKDDILFGKLRPYLDNRLHASFSGIAVGDFWILRSTKSASNYTYALIQADHFRTLANQTSGTKMPRSDWSNVSNEEYRIPKSMREQSEIGKLFDTLDETIALHQRKYENLQAVKKELLKRMFASDKKPVPDFRFNGYTNDWEQRKLGDIAVITFGQSPDGKNYTDNPNDHILVQGNADIKDGHVVPRVWTKQVTKSALPGDLIFSVRAPVGDVGMTDFPVVLGRGVAGFKANQFVFFLLEKLKLEGYWTRYSSGSTFESVNSKDVKTAPVLSPSTIEQEQIGAFIAVINDTIALHQRKLEDLKQLKKVLLQKLFV
ncbi:restriction endonuclease subunit S [Lacticaseibacillus mingshuiensis]|uniref:restriction endonuclease subunit S n=1 Tax=Lacticaseibacillus mingshuiensis TaxID=2799574 RepID=UPI0019505012|nr:restriction endonuclease subunit S [Lacticaseibacillus mingshuiensis]